MLTFLICERPMSHGYPATQAPQNLQYIVATKLFWVPLFSSEKGYNRNNYNRNPQPFATAIFFLRFFNAFDLQQILSIPMPRVMEFVKLFDPVGFAKANATKAAQDLERVRNFSWFERSWLFFLCFFSIKQKK